MVRHPLVAFIGLLGPTPGLRPDGASAAAFVLSAAASEDPTIKQFAIDMAERARIVSRRVGLQ